VASLLAQANADLDAAQTALAAGNLGAYQSDVNQAHIAVQQANQLPASSSTSTTAPGSGTSAPSG
jgi:hypothetical protein